MRGDGEVTATDAEVAVSADALAAVVASGQGDGEVAARDIDIGVTLDSCAIGWNILVVHRFQDSASRRNNGEIAARDVDFTISFDAFRHVAGMPDSDGASADENVAVGLDAFAVGACVVHIECSVIHSENARHLDASLTFRRCVDGQVTVLDGDVARNVEAIRTCRHDDKCTVIPNQVTTAMDAVTVGFSNYNGAGIDRHNAFHRDAMLSIACDLYRSSTTNG